MPGRLPRSGFASSCVDEIVEGPPHRGAGDPHERQIGGDIDHHVESALGQLMPEAEQDVLDQVSRQRALEGVPLGDVGDARVRQKIVMSTNLVRRVVSCTSICAYSPTASGPVTRPRTRVSPTASIVDSGVLSS